MVRAGKLKSGAGKKLNRWKSSSQSNPDTTKHRNSAFARKGIRKFQDGTTGSTGLTADNLRVLDRMTGAAPREDDLISEWDLNSEISGASFNTFVSGVSDCTNMTFNRVKKHWEKNPEKHKEVVAVLAAITEIIRDKGLKDESEAAYFAVLSTTLTQVVEEETLAAVSHLFSLNLRKVAPGVINQSFSSLVQMFMSLLVKGHNSTALLKSLVSCLGTVLKRGTTFESWSNQDAKSALQALLAFVLHPKPKVRKAAQKAAALLIHTPGIAQSCVEEIARFSLSELQKAQKETHTLQLLTFLRATIYMFPLQQQKELCQACLKLLNLQSQMVRIQALRTINEYLRGIVRQAQKAALGDIENQTVETDVDDIRQKLTEIKLNGIPVDLIGKLLSAMKEVKPSSRDVSVCSSWLEVVFSCCFVLAASSNPRMVLSHIPHLIENIYSLLEEPDNGGAVGSTIQKIMTECGRHLTDLDLKEDGAGDLILKELVNGLQFQYSSVMDCTMDGLGSFYESLRTDQLFNDQVLKFLAAPLVNLAQLRLSPVFGHKIALDSCAGSILGALGPDAFLGAIPLNITGNPEVDGDIPIKWVFPILETKLRENVKLSVFFKSIAMLAEKLLTSARSLDKFQSAPYYTLYRELWALFPKFCHNPADKPFELLKPANAKGLNTILESQEKHHQEIKQHVLSGIRKLSIFSSDPERDQFRKTMGKFAPNYMKTLLELYRSKELSANAMSTAKELVKVTPPAKLEQFYKVAQDKAQNDTDEAMRPLYWDIVSLIVPWLEADQVDSAFCQSLAMARNDSAILQKKAWRVLEQIASTENQVCQTIMRGNEENIIKGFMSTLGSVAASARKPRLQLLDIMLPNMPVDTLNGIISELVLCTKDKNAISRALSYTILTKICTKYCATGEERAVLPFIQMLLQGLTGNPLTVSCTLNVLNITMHEFRKEIPGEVHDMILENVLVLMSSQAREILKSTVSFLITLTKILTKDALAAHVEKIVTALVNWKPQTRNPFRVKVRRLFERLIKKFGFELVQKFVPEKSPLAKMLGNAKKIRARNERRQAEKDEARNNYSDDEDLPDADQNLDDLINETDSEADDDDDVKVKRGKKTKKFTDQLMETEDGEVVDLSAAHHAFTTESKKRPLKTRKDEDDDEIGSAPDGRIIVREKKNKKEDIDMLSSDEEDGLPENIRMSDQKIAMSDDREAGRKSKGRKRDEETSNIYKTKKGHGDVKRKNRPDPYSYLPLRKDMLNKRRKQKGDSVPGLKNIIHGAKRGAQKGKKNRTRDHK